MRDKFSELIKQGVASFNPKPVASPLPEQDPICRMYNGCWGLLSDTHMSKIDDDYIITGTFTQSRNWENFKYSYWWGSTNIKLATGYYSLDDMARKNNLCMSPDVYNGDNIIRLKHCESSQTQGPAVACDGIGCNYYTTSESQIPHPLSDIFSKEQISEFVEAWVDAKGNAIQIVENLKNAKTLNGDLFRISSDNQYLIGQGSQVIKFKLNHAS